MGDRQGAVRNSVESRQLEGLRCERSHYPNPPEVLLHESGKDPELFLKSEPQTPELGEQYRLRFRPTEGEASNTSIEYSNAAPPMSRMTSRNARSIPVCTALRVPSMSRMPP